MIVQNCALITGGSAGLGKELALQCASLGFNLILIALPGGNIRYLARQIELEYQVQVHVFELDITHREHLVDTLSNILQTHRIRLLINNAGIGGTASMLDSPMETIDRIIQLNVRGTTTVTRMLLPHLLTQKEAYIMNIASMAAFLPIAYKTVYPASKAFISSFSLGLREELRDTGVSVSVVYPGAILTNSDVCQRIVSLGSRGRVGLLPTARIARFAMQQTLAKKAVIIPGIFNRIGYRLMKLIPLEIKLKMVSKSIRDELNVARA